MWLSDLKKALILQELDTLEYLIFNMPSFDSLEDIEQATYLLQSTKILLEAERSSTLHSLGQIKSTIDFLKATQHTPTSSINLKL
jgi:hypothetical protein